jgi:hypothetical protein
MQNELNNLKWVREEKIGGEGNSLSGGEGRVVFGLLYRPLESLAFALVYSIHIVVQDVSPNSEVLQLPPPQPPENLNSPNSRTVI